MLRVTKASSAAVSFTRSVKEGKTANLGHGCGPRLSASIWSCAQIRRRVLVVSCCPRRLPSRHAGATERRSARRLQIFSVDPCEQVGKTSRASAGLAPKKAALGASRSLNVLTVRPCCRYGCRGRFSWRRFLLRASGRRPRSRGSASTTVRTRPAPTSAWVKRVSGAQQPRRTPPPGNSRAESFRLTITPLNDVISAYNHSIGWSDDL